jgi:hypothetical protein
MGLHTPDITVTTAHIKSSFHSLIPFLPLLCNCQFRRLNSIQFLCSQDHILAGWHPETGLCMDHTENRASLLKEACLLIRCLAIDVLLLHTLAPIGMCLPSRCLAMSLYVAILLMIVFE